MRKTVQISVSFKQFSDDDQQNFVTSLSNAAGVKSEEVKIVSVKTIGSGRRVDEGIEVVAEIETSAPGQVQSSVMRNLEQQLKRVGLPASSGVTVMILDPIIQDAALADATPAIEGGSGSAGVSPGSAAPARLQVDTTNLPQQNGASNLVAIAVGAGAGVMLVLGMIVFACLRGRAKLAPVDIRTPVSKGHLGQNTGIVVEIDQGELSVSSTFVFATATERGLETPMTGKYA